eukprot:scpid54448/ scgid26354/ Histone-lysine N-methyltransferase SETD1B; SET domain-containing protein 1B
MSQAPKNTVTRDAPRQYQCYKLLVDPAIVGKGRAKAYRYDGKPPSGHPSVQVTDPRTSLFKTSLANDHATLPVPRFKFDRHSVGTPVARDVFLSGLNDNANEKFLRGLCQGYGEIEKVRIYRHPDSKKHLGLAKIGYMYPSCARKAASALQGRSVMGNTVTAVLDAKGEESRKAVQAAINPKPAPDNSASSAAGTRVGLSPTTPLPGTTFSMPAFPASGAAVNVLPASSTVLLQNFHQQRQQQQQFQSIRASRGRGGGGGRGRGIAGRGRGNSKVVREISIASRQTSTGRQHKRWQRHSL